MSCHTCRDTPLLIQVEKLLGSNFDSQDFCPYNTQLYATLFKIRMCHVISRKEKKRKIFDTGIHFELTEHV